MSNITSKVYEYIDNIILFYIKNNIAPEIICSSCKVNIDNKNFNMSIWRETIGDVEILVFEIRRKRLLFENVYTKGVVFNGDDYKILSNEEMWDYGF